MAQHPETMIVERDGREVRINKADFDPKRERDPAQKTRRRQRKSEQPGQDGEGESE